MVYVTEPAPRHPRTAPGPLRAGDLTGGAFVHVTAADAARGAGLLAVLAARQAFPPGTRPERLRRDCPPGG